MALIPCASITSGLNGQSCDANPGGVSEFMLTNYDQVDTVTITGGTVSAISYLGSTVSFF